MRIEQVGSDVPRRPEHQMDYTSLSLAEIADGLDEVANEAQATFGALSADQLNWRSSVTQWSVAQCLDHLLTCNRLMLVAAAAALKRDRRRTMWERLPGLPGLVGPMLIKSQVPESTRRHAAPANARPSASAIAADVVATFVAQQHNAATEARRLDERFAAQMVMTSPFIRLVTYTVLDGWRLMLAHDRRHVQQARRVTALPTFPRE
jgi:hypothetical protein